MCVGETGVGEMGVGEMGQIIGKTGVGETGVDEMGVIWGLIPSSHKRSERRHKIILHPDSLREKAI